MELVELSLLTNQGVMPEKSGLNWGQRLRRERNQAYLAVPAAVYRTNFFPAIAARFTLTTDDGRSFTCVVQQAGGKAISTPENNSLLGLYFRERLGVQSGDRVTHEALLHYGRTSVTIQRIDATNYQLDFSVN